MKIVHVFPYFRRYGGAQKVILNLHDFFGRDFDSYLLSFQTYNSIHGVFKQRVKREEYISFRFSNFRLLRDCVVFSHDRKMTAIFMLLRFFVPFQLVHISHGVYYSFKWATIFPKIVVAVSDAVRTNLLEYFKVDNESIHVIYNGIEDHGKEEVSVRNRKTDNVKILFLGRIDQNKQQVSLVQELKGLVDPKIEITFAGEGADSDFLRTYIKKNNLCNQFHHIGFQTEIHRLILDHDFVLLFSKNEGLGISLIESCMMGRPVITKAIGGSAACGEICIDGYNGFIANSFDELRSVLNRSVNISPAAYFQLCLNARNVYNDKFRIEIMRKNYSSLLSSLILNEYS